MIKRAFKNKSELVESDYAGCYHCIRIFPSKDIKEWVDDDQTAICPLCLVDSVVPYSIFIDESLDNFKIKLTKAFKKHFEKPTNKA